MAEPSSSSSDSDSDDGKISPKKVHFSEIDQVTFLYKSSASNLNSKVKLMSQESLASMAASEGSETTICTSLPPSIQCPALARLVTTLWPAGTACSSSPEWEWEIPHCLAP